MTKKSVTQMYRDWRKAHNNQKPNRAIVEMFWEDGDNTDKGYQIDTIDLRLDYDNDVYVLYNVSGLSGLLSLMNPDNGSGFVVKKVVEFYKLK